MYIYDFDSLSLSICLFPYIYICFKQYIYIKMCAITCISCT